MVDTLVTVFTKDNLNRVRCTLPQYSKLDYPIILLDDSVESKNSKRCREICQQNGIIYHGRPQQKRLLAELPVCAISEFISKLGTEGWTLGKTRNYALLISRAMCAKKLVMVDDDIQLSGTLDFESAIDGLDLFDYVGAYIEGMPDHSIVGYLARSAGFHQDCYVSGSFLGIRTSEVSNYFLNKYNEDWIWLLLENEGEKPPQLGSVYQLKYNPFEQPLEVANNQEFGEILLNGVFKIEPELAGEQLINKEYWEDILRARRDEVQNIGRLNVPPYLQTTQEVVVESVINTISKMRPDEFAQVFESYFKTLPKWQQLLDDASKTDINDGLIY